MPDPVVQLAGQHSVPTFCGEPVLRQGQPVRRRRAEQHRCQPHCDAAGEHRPSHGRNEHGQAAEESRPPGGAQSDRFEEVETVLPQRPERHRRTGQQAEDAESGAQPGKCVQHGPRRAA